jgi:hypothetical protein
MTKPSRNIAAQLEYYASEENEQRLLAAFDLLFAGIDIHLSEDAHLTELAASLSWSMKEAE